MKLAKNLTLSFLLFIVLGVTTAYAQEAKKVFINMPDSLSPLLTSVNRADLVDFLESKMKAQVENRFGNKSEMTDLGKDYIRIQMTPQTTWQMKLLALNDTTRVICTISTACAPVCDSSIQFYSIDWNPLPTNHFISMPAMADFFITSDSTVDFEFNSVRSQIDMALMKIDLSKANDELKVTLTTAEYIEKEMAEKLKPFLRHPFVYYWKSGTFSK